MEEEQLTIRQVADAVGRLPHTIRDWEREGVLPTELRAHRSPRGWRYWTKDQVDGIIKWLKDTDRRPGKALGGPRPSDEHVQQHIERMRHPRATAA